MSNDTVYFKSLIIYNNNIDLSKYKGTQRFECVCNKCKKAFIKKQINLIKDTQNILCRSCKLKETWVGYDWSARNKKSQEIKLKKYGDPFYTNPQKISSSLLNRSAEKKKETYNRIKETNKNRYGCHPAQRSEQKERVRQTCLVRYNVNTPSQSEEVKEKYKETCLKKYGVENAFQADVIREKIKQTNLERYGVENPKQSQNIQEKIKQTCLKKYGVEHPWSNLEVRKKCFKRYIYNNINFDSSWELYCYIYLAEHNIEFIYQPDVQLKYVIHGKTHTYYPDFLINGKLYEIKGDQFFDEDGLLINPYDPSMNDIYGAKYKCMVDNNINILKKGDLNHIFEYVDNKYGNHYITSFRKN